MGNKWPDVGKGQTLFHIEGQKFRFGTKSGKTNRRGWSPPILFNITEAIPAKTAYVLDVLQDDGGHGVSDGLTGVNGALQAVEQARPNLDAHCVLGFG